jgi:Cof subfamily protein (haloacid dehalogenase superfamily)
MSVRLIATDLDGTLVRSDGRTISDRTRDALAAAEAAGLIVVLVTGRPPRWMDEVAEITGHTGLAICANGALLYDLHTDSVVDSRLLAPDTLRAVVACLRAEIPDLRFGVEYGMTFAHEPGYRHGWAIGPPQARVGPVDAIIDQAAAKLLARHPTLDPDELLRRAVTALGENATVTHSSDYGLLEISAYGVTKASALAELAAQHGVAAAEVIAFGDMPNDLAMLAWAGRAVAVANAHPQVLTAADEVTGSNDEDGVAQVVERLVADRPGAERADKRA